MSSASSGLKTSREPTGWWRGYAGFWWGSASRRFQWTALVCGLCLLVLVNQWFHTHKDIARPHRYLGVSAEVLYLPPAPALRMASLGHQSFLADLLFVRVAHYFVDHLLSDSQLPFIDLYMEAIWALDAHNQASYRWGAQVIKFGQTIDERVNTRANHFARLGLEFFPKDGWLYHEIAYNLFAYKHRYDSLEAQRREKLALEYLARAYEMPGFSFDPNYLAHQYARAGRDDDSVKAAMASYATGTSEQRRELRLRLRQRDKSDAADTLAWLDHSRRRDWPHLNETLAMLVGPKRVAAPPLRYERAHNWLPERPVDKSLLDELGIRELRPPAGYFDPQTRLDSAEDVDSHGQVSLRGDAGAPDLPSHVFTAVASTATRAPEKEPQP